MRTWRLLLLSFATFVAISDCQTPSCGENELLKDCPEDCETDYCPTNEGPYKSCSKPKTCEPKCKCIFDFKRNNNGTCIETRKCPPFECKQPNEEYNPCPPLCPSDSCSMAKYKGRCPPMFGRIGLVLPCTPACRCKSGHWRNSTNVCVEAKYCDVEIKGFIY